MGLLPSIPRAFVALTLLVGLAACAKSDPIEGVSEDPSAAAGGGSRGDGGAAAAGGGGPGTGASGSTSGGTTSGQGSSGTDATTGSGGGATTATGSSASTASGVSCGNDVAEGDEACDGTDLLAQTCLTQGFASGTLACEACAFDTSGCVAAPGCENGVDDDGDGLIDALDPACTGAGDDDELTFAPNCNGAGAPVVDLTHAAGLPIVFTGTTVGLGNAFTATGTASCPTTPGGEVAFRLVVPQVIDLLVSLDNPGTTELWDPVLYVRSATCVGTQVGCNDDANGGAKSELVLGALPAGTYFIFVDSAGSSGAFEITIEEL